MMRHSERLKLASKSAHEGSRKSESVALKSSVSVRKRCTDASMSGFTS